MRDLIVALLTNDLFWLAVAVVSSALYLSLPLR